MEHVQNMTACHGSFHIWMNIKHFVERLQWIGIKHCLAPIEQRPSIRASLRTNRQRTCQTSRRLESSGALSNSARAATYIFRFISPMRRQDKTKTSAAKNSQVRVSNREFCGEDMQQKKTKNYALTWPKKEIHPRIPNFLLEKSITRSRVLFLRRYVETTPFFSKEYAHPKPEQCTTVCCTKALKEQETLSHNEWLLGGGEGHPVDTEKSELAHEKLFARM